jgi:hypothetical protein
MDSKLIMSPKVFVGFILLSLYITIFGLFWPIDFKCFVTGGECLKVYGYPFVIYKMTMEGQLIGNRNLWVLLENFVFWMFFLTLFWVILMISLKALQKLSDRGGFKITK